MSIRCGHCGGRHETVGEVRSCSESTLSLRAKTYTHLSRKQQDYLGSILTYFGCALSDGATPETVSYEAGKPILDAMIEARKMDTAGQDYPLPAGVVRLSNPSKGARKERTMPRPAMPDVPAGYYAIPSLTGNNDLDFYRVKIPSKGTWEGWTFVDRVIGGHPELPVRGKTARQALEAIIEFGIENAGILYGQKIGQCYNCNRHLTEKASRALSLGRHCAGLKGLGADWDALNAKLADVEVDA